MADRARDWFRLATSGRVTFRPHVRKLKGVSPDTWRYRIGAWRFFYEIDDDEGVVFMIAASHRGSAY